MLKAFKLKSDNFILKIIYFIINVIVSLFVGIINLFISFSLWFYKLLIKPYKNEAIYIFFSSIVIIVFCILGLNEVQDTQYISLVKYIQNYGYYILLCISSLIAILSIILHILKRKKILVFNKKQFWYLRSVSYLLTAIVIFFAVDYLVLDFISRYITVTKPVADTSSYDVMIYFLREYQNRFMQGIKVTLLLALLGTLIGLILAFGLVSLRMLNNNPNDNDLVKFFKKIGRGFANIYVTVIRGTPMIVQAFIFYYLILGIVRPSMNNSEYRYFIDFVWTPFRAGLFTVSINTAAYLTEVLRGGINSIDKGQKEAAESIGLSKFQTMRLIILPQAIKNALPSIGNEFIINIKDTSVLTMIGVLDLFSVSKQDILGVFSAKSLEAYLLVAIYYLILTYLTSKLLQYFEKKMNMPVKEITSSN